MGLGLPTGGGGDFIPYLKYNAKAGRWYSKNDGGDEFEVTQMTAVFDMAGIKTGLLQFVAGQAPDFVFDSSVGDSDAIMPDGGRHKRGFQILVFAEKSFVGVREFAATAAIVNTAMNALYDAWEAAPESAAGKCPVVSCVAVNPVESKHGINYGPDLQIVGWADKPGAFEPAPQQAAPQQAAPAAPAVPPPAQPAAQQSSATEF